MRQEAMDIISSRAAALQAGGVMATVTAEGDLAGQKFQFHLGIEPDCFWQALVHAATGVRMTIPDAIWAAPVLGITPEEAGISVTGPGHGIFRATDDHNDRGHAIMQARRIGIDPVLAARIFKEDPRDAQDLRGIVAQLWRLPVAGHG